MKKDKKSKKSEVKNGKSSKKDTKKKKSLNENQKNEVSHKKEKSSLSMDFTPSKSVDSDHLKDTMVHASSLYQSILVLPQSFNVSNETYSLYPSEIKALAIIGEFPNINLTQVASKLDISKSAVSKSTTKLLEKKLITKERSKINIREVVFMLSENGTLIYNQLNQANATLFEPLTQKLCSLSKEEQLIISSLFSDFNDYLTDLYSRLT